MEEKKNMKYEHTGIVCPSTEETRFRRKIVKKSHPLPKHTLIGANPVETRWGGESTVKSHHAPLTAGSRADTCFYVIDAVRSFLALRCSIIKGEMSSV